jgi:uncharacterized protein (DUF433 family)
MDGQTSSQNNSAIMSKNGNLVNIMSANLIVSDPKIMMGKPVVQGTRITVELILEKMAAGETVEQLLGAHPRLTKETIQAALAYAAHTLRSDIVYPTNYPVRL